MRFPEKDSSLPRIVYSAVRDHDGCRRALPNLDVTEADARRLGCERRKALALPGQRYRGRSPLAVEFERGHGVACLHGEERHTERLRGSRLESQRGLGRLEGCRRVDPVDLEGARACVRHHDEPGRRLPDRGLLEVESDG